MFLLVEYIFFRLVCTTSGHLYDQYLLKFTSTVFLASITVLEWRPWINQHFKVQLIVCFNLCNILFQFKRKLDFQFSDWHDINDWCLQLYVHVLICMQYTHTFVILSTKGPTKFVRDSNSLGQSMRSRHKESTVYLPFFCPLS